MPDRTSGRWMEGPWHPFLFAAYPVLYLMSQNTDHAGLNALVRPLAVVLIATGLLLSGGSLILNDRRRAAAACTAIVIMAFTFGLYGRTTWQLVWALVGFAVVFGYVLLGRSDWGRVARGLNAFGIALVLVPAAAIARASTTPAPYAFAPEATRSGNATPNIYYLILDGYGREDVLREYYGYDNAPFVAFLREHGFVVNDDARSNYAWTILSLASSLNYEHAVTMAEEMNLTGSSLQPLIALTRNNRLMAYLRGQGYAIHGYMPGYMRGNLVGADYVHRAWWAPTEFESALLDFTPIPPIMWRLSLPTAHEFHRRLQLHTLDAAEQLSDLPSPKMVFVHLLCPHPPFVFGPLGEPKPQPEARFTLKDGSAIVGSVMTREQYVDGYRDQVDYLNTRLRKIIANLRKDDPSAIIVLQGDHGPASMAKWTSIEQTNMRERFGILNAVHAPGAPREVQAAFQTPVNTFRLILAHYFGGNLAPLPNTSYFTLENDPYDFYPVDFADAQ